MNGSEGTGAEYAKSVQDVLEHAADADSAAGRRTPPRNPFLTSGLGLCLVTVVFAGVMFYNIRLYRAQPEPLAPEEAEMASGLSLMIATQAVEAFRDEHGRLPASLAELGFPEGTVKYRVEGDEYELGAPQGSGGDTVRFSSEQGPLGILQEMGLTLGEPTGIPDGPIR